MEKKWFRSHVTRSNTKVYSVITDIKEPTRVQSFQLPLFSAVVSAVMQHRMLRDAQKAMAPWMNGQPIYAPISSNVSSQGVPILYSGEGHESTIRLICNPLLNSCPDPKVCCLVWFHKWEDTMKLKKKNLKLCEHYFLHLYPFI